MKRLEEVSIGEMEKNCRLQILKADLTTVIKSEKRQEVLSKYEKFERHEKRKNPNHDERDMVIQFLIENEEDVDKGKVLLITLSKYLEGKEALNDRNHPLHNIYMQEKKLIEDFLERTEAMAEEILRGENLVISRTIKYPWEKDYFVQVILSKELVDKIPFPGERKRERESKKVINALPNKALLIAVLIANESMTDKEIYKVSKLGRDILNTTLQNAEAKGCITHELMGSFKNMPKTYSTNYITDRIQPVAKEN